MSESLTRPKYFAKGVFRSVRIFLDDHPKFKRNTLVMLTSLGLYGMARTCYARLMAATNQSGLGMGRNFTVKDIAHLPPRARRIYADLKAAIEKNKEGC